MPRSWSIKNLYFYLVSLVTLFLFVGGTISAANNAMQLILPDKPNIPLTQAYFREYRETGEEVAFDPPPLNKLETIRAEQEKEFSNYQGWAQRELLNSIALMIIAAPFYWYHWKQIKPNSFKANKGGCGDEG
ncbi:MAG: hypothetical protein ACQES4_11610 [Bacillota bacterium]